MKLDATQMIEINKMIEVFNKNTGIELDLSEILTDLGTKLESKENFRDAYLSVYKDVLNKKVVPGVLSQFKDGKTVNYAGTHFNNVMEAIWDSLAPEKDAIEDEEFSKALSKDISERTAKRNEINNEIKDLKKQMKKLDEKMYSNDAPSARAQKKEREINEKLNKNYDELEELNETGKVINGNATLFGHMSKGDYNNMVREAFRNNVHLAGESVPSYKLIARSNRDLTINRALMDSSFTSANSALTWDEYKVEDFRALLGTVSESYMILHEKVGNMPFFKRIFSKEARELRGEMASCLQSLNDIQNRMVDKGLITKNEKLDIKNELKVRAESMREMPDQIKTKIDGLFLNFSADIPEEAMKEARKAIIEEPKKIQRIEINEIEEDKKEEEIVPIVNEEASKNEALDESTDLFKDF